MDVHRARLDMDVLATRVPAIPRARIAARVLQKNSSRRNSVPAPDAPASVAGHAVHGQVHGDVVECHVPLVRAPDGQQGADAGEERVLLNGLVM